MISSLSAFAPESLVSRDGFGSPVPRQAAHLHTQAEFGAYLWDSSRVPRRCSFVRLNRHTPSTYSPLKEKTAMWYKISGKATSSKKKKETKAKKDADSCQVSARGCRGACVSKNDCTKVRGFNESIKTKTKQKTK